MIEEVTVKQEPSMEDEPVTVSGNREDYLLSTEKKNQQFAPPLFCVDLKCEFQACVFSFSMSCMVMHFMFQVTKWFYGRTDYVEINCFVIYHIFSMVLMYFL